MSFNTWTRGNNCRGEIFLIDREKHRFYKNWRSNYAVAKDLKSNFVQTETKTPNNSVRLDFPKCVQIFISFKTQICIGSVPRFFRHCADLRY